MSKKQADIPIIQEIKLSELIIDTSLSGRTEKELKENAKEKAELLEAFGGWDSTQPGAYVTRSGKKHLVRGFSRVMACGNLGLKVGYFIELPDDPAALRAEPITSNFGRSISPFEQGRIFSAMQTGTDAEKAEKGEVVLSPMTTAQIAESIGCKRQWVEECIGIFKSTPEIAELIIDGKVSPSIVHRANQLVKADGKRLAFLKAAYNLAVSEGKQTATMQHLNAVRADFAPLKAAKPETDDQPAAHTKREKEKPASNGEKSGEEKEEPAAQSEMAMETGTQKPSAATKKTRHEEIAGAIAFVVNERKLDLEDADIEAIAAAIVRLQIPF